MRKVILGMNMTLDGFVAGPNGELDWMFQGFDADLASANLRALGEIDTFLMGRVNYEAMAPHWQNANDDIARLMNAAEKVVFSTTLTSVDWENTRLATAAPAQEIAQLQARSGRGIGIAGGPTFAQAVAHAGLLDEVRLTIHPVVLGEGKRLFAEPLRLKPLDDERFATGVVIHTYEPMTGEGTPAAASLA